MEQIKKEPVLDAIGNELGDKCSLYTIKLLMNLSEALSSRLMGKPNKAQIETLMSDVRFGLDLISNYLKLDDEEIESNYEALYEELSKCYKL